MDFSRDGSQVGLGASDGSVRIHAVPAGEEVKRLSPRLAPRWVRFHPEARQLAVGNPGSGDVRLLDVESGQVIRNLSHDKAVWSVCWSNDGRLLATGCKDYVWDTATGERQTSCKGISARRSPSGSTRPTTCCSSSVPFEPNRCGVRGYLTKSSRVAPMSVLLPATLCGVRILQRTR